MYRNSTELRAPSAGHAEQLAEQPNARERNLPAVVVSIAVGVLVAGMCLLVQEDIRVTRQLDWQLAHVEVELARSNAKLDAALGRLPASGQ